MILKSLLIQGFKSFPYKTEIKFSDGVTAIVGPNGSGKSNISDALRWVLGEQSSRSLRGAKMEDVIFGGTEQRGPLGFAEVSLILDNSSGLFANEHTEIMITRRFYRSGESEYSLNKKPCRLKDIHELLMDTGLGREGYSIIGQGRIDEILSLKSEDRREIFEEAAGITKFRYRKEEAERKLLATEENLVRIRDIYAELESQIKPLEKQAEKAKKYLFLRDKRKEFELSLWLDELEKLKDELDDSQKKLEICKNQLYETRKNVDLAYENIENLSKNIQLADIRADRLRRELRESEQMAAKRQSDRAVLKANIENAEQNIERTLEDEKKRKEQTYSLKTKQNGRQVRCDRLKKDTERLENLKKQADYILNEQKKRKSCANMDKKGLEEQIQLVKGEHFQLSLKLTAAKTGLEGMADRHENLDKNIEKAKEQLEWEEKIHTGYLSKLNTCETKLSEVKSQLEKHKLTLTQSETELTALKNKIQDEKIKLSDCQNRKAMLTEMQRDYEGFSGAVKLIMKRSDEGKQQGICGPVSSLIKTKSEFITAIETALGAAASNIVVKTANDAKNAIEVLKRKNGGRATFLPLDTIKSNVLKEQNLQQNKGCYGTADLLVSCKDEYKNIVSNLLARTVVVENLDDAMNIAKKYNHRFRIVTLDGQMIQAGGAMTGGSISKTTGALSRTDQLERLNKAENDILCSLGEHEQSFKKLDSAFNEQNERLKQLKNDEQSLSNEQMRLITLKKQHEIILSQIKSRYDILKLEKKDLTEAKTGYNDTIKQNETEKKNLEEKLFELENKIKRHENTIKSCDEAITEYEAKLVGYKTEFAQYETELLLEKRGIEELKRLENEMQSGIEQTKIACEAFKNQISIWQAEIKKLDTEDEKQLELESEIRSKSEKLTGERMQLEAQKNLCEKDIQKQNDELLSLERENTRLEMQNSQIKQNSQNILDKMWEEYELTPSPAAKLAIPIENRSEAVKQLDEIKHQMRELGSVNLDAVEQYKTLMERFDFLSEQKNDLESAKNDLNGIINQLTENMKTVFSEEFKKLNTYFGETFKEIFGGGSASIKLTDESDILNCGIDIYVSPPGKAVKTITLLSGGEKAFVAIALYFAILKLRPTPFSVLDEIEAALDDVNVTRYAKYLRRLSKKTQFIVITHRRGTMEEADMLYGVTMQEKGVSRLIMLNLAQAEKQFSGQIN